MIDGRRLRRGPKSTLYKHGLSGTKLHAVWRGMLARCSDQQHISYRNYGGRGITVCERWRDSYLHFLADMGERPFAGAQLDRIDCDGPYSQENCRWVTRTENNRNHRKERMLSYNGKTMCTVAWAEELGINRNTLRLRIKAGWPPERVFTYGWAR